MSEHTDEQIMMAEIMGFHPYRPETWPMADLNHLVDFRKNASHEDFHRELRKVMKRWWPHE
jgi:hypothetical protein